MTKAEAVIATLHWLKDDAGLVTDDIFVDYISDSTITGDDAIELADVLFELKFSIRGSDETQIEQCVDYINELCATSSEQRYQIEQLVKEIK